MRPFSIAGALLLVLSQLPAQEQLFREADRAVRSSVGNELLQLLDAGADEPTTIALAAIAGSKLPQASSAADKLRAALRRANATADLDRLRRDLDDVATSLTFEPMIEADVPAGFPKIGVVDELEIRHYPAYRMARTEMRSGSNSAFWPLFQHIKSNDIAMTTPVQMDWQKDGGRRPSSMAFLYGKPTQETKKKADNVDVVEIAPMTVLTIGAIGNDRRGRVEQLRRRLMKFLNSPGCRYEPAGSMRTMGYNSPMVRRDRRYFEVQIPVRLRSI